MALRKEQMLALLSQSEDLNSIPDKRPTMYMLAEFLKFCFVLQIFTIVSYFCWFTTNLLPHQSNSPNSYKWDINEIFNFDFEIQVFPNLRHWPVPLEAFLFCYCVIPETTNFHQVPFISKRSNFPAVLLKSLWNFKFLLISTNQSTFKYIVTCRCVI
jgi:hypothetical protein